jgi:hypothetical protein
MPSILATRALALAAVLAACTADVGSTQSNSDSASETASDNGDTSTAQATSTAPTSTAPMTTEPTTTEPMTTAPMTTEPTTTEPTSTGASTSDAIGTTSDASTGGETSMTGTSDAGTIGGDTDGGTTGPDGALGPAAMDAMAALEQAVAGVTYPSESDYPWVVVGFADAAPVSEANVKQVIAAVYVAHEGEAGLADRAIELRTLAQLIDPLTTPQDWWEDYNKMVAAQYSEVRAVLESKLVDIQVFRFGEQQGDVLQGAVDVYVLGATPDGDIVGMWTVSIET